MDGIKKQDDLLKNAIAKTINKEAVDISIGDSVKKNRKKKKKVKIEESSSSAVAISSGEGLEVIYETQYINFDKIDGRGKRVFKVKSNVFEWDKPLDFVYYVFDIYKKKFDVNLNLNSTAATLEINRMRDELYDMSGNISSLISKDYITFCFNNFIPSTIKRGKKFYFNQLRNNLFMKTFLDTYNYSQSLKREHQKKNKKEEKVVEKLDNSRIEQSYLISEKKMVEDSGIIISINWLMIKKSMAEQDAIDIVLSVCKTAFKRGTFKKIEKATLKWSPYPDKFIYTSQFKCFLNKINRDIFVKFENNDRYNFLTKGENGASN